MPSASPNRWKVCAFRLAAVLIGLAPLVLVEAALVVLDIGHPSESGDPFVGFSSVRPLFVPSGDGARYEIAPYRLEQFVLESFEADKPAAAFRIFVIGDSTVQGNPWSIETSFTKWLELSLQAADPSRHWDVVNCGGISYASYRVVPIVQEVLGYQPDLLIVHSSHNEFLEDRTYGRIKRMPRGVAWTCERLSRLRTTNVLSDGVRRLAGRAEDNAAKDRTVLAAEVEALLDYRGGLEFYHRDDEWRQGVIAHYEFNLRRMAAIARDAGVPCIFINPALNLRDSPPFKSEHRADISADEADRFDELWTEARSYYANDRPRALRLLRAAVAIDDQHAGLRYDIAKCLDAMGLVEDARREYVAAKELDICPLRILESMNQAVLDVGHDTQTPVMDARKLFEQLSRHGIPGGDWFVDHVHPSIRGYQMLAGELADELVRLGVVRPGESWTARRDELYAEHLRSLDTLYFTKGQQHLDGLMTWAQGRVTKQRPASTKGPKAP